MDEISDPGPGETDDNTDRLFGQLEWFADELQAQRRFIRQLPEKQLTASPIPDEPSIREMYEGLLRAECSRHLPIVAKVSGLEPSAVPSPEDCETVDELLQALVAARNRLVWMLRETESESLGSVVEDASAGDVGAGSAGKEEMSVLDYVYQIALNDGEILRSIGERFYESDLRFSRSL